MTSSPRALASRDFRLLFGGQIISLTGSQMQQVAIAWQLYLLTHSSMALGLLGLFRVAPLIVFALGGGVIADALDRRRLLVASQTAFALISLALAVLTHLGHVDAMTIYLLSALAGVASAFDSPARQALIPLLVTREELPSALSLSAMAWQIAAVAGPALGGVALAWRGVVPIYVFDSVSFLGVIGALLVIHPRPVAPSASGVSFAAAWEGLRFLRRTPIILQAMLLDFVATLFAGALLLMPIFADKLLHVGPRGLGLLYAAQPLGAAIAAALLSVLPTPRRQGLTVLTGVAIYGASIAAFGVARSLPLALLFLAISGAADTVSMVVRQTLRQLLTPDELRGRMTSVNMIFFMGGPQLGEVEAGAVASGFGARISVASGGIACLIGGLVMAIAFSSLRRLTTDDYRLEEVAARASEPT